MKEITVNSLNHKKCACQREHIFNSEIISGKGALNSLPDVLIKLGARKVFLLADANTYKAAGEKVLTLLTGPDISVSKFVFNENHIHPDDYHVGLAFMNYDKSCDAIIAVGSGVINDIGKIISSIADKPYIIVATAPSMDGYASATSSVTRAGLKISLNTKCADVIIGDTDILAEAPIKMMLSGLGDMIAKYTSICEWRIGALITGEYYCENIASLVRSAVKKCIDNACGLLLRDKTAVSAVFDGLVATGVAMNYAGVSRPASGTEHYISHVWDMRSAEFSTPTDFHGIQCGIGSLITIRLYEKLLETTPDREKAISFAESFNYPEWKETLKDFLGKGADSIIELEKSEKKYDTEKHKERLEKILSNWENIKKIIKEELPSSEMLENLLKKLGAPTTPEEIGIDPSILETTFFTTKDIRDKYILPRLCFDLGIIEEII